MDTFESLARGVCGDPFSLLGIHRDAEGGWVVRAFLPWAEGITLRVIPLFPQPDDRSLFVRIAGEETLVERAELLGNTDVEERQSLVGAFPTALVIAIAALLLVLAASERLLGRLDWRVAR